MRLLDLAATLIDKLKNLLNAFAIKSPHRSRAKSRDLGKLSCQVIPNTGCHRPRQFKGVPHPDAVTICPFALDDTANEALQDIYREILLGQKLPLHTCCPVCIWVLNDTELDLNHE